MACKSEQYYLGVMSSASKSLPYFMTRANLENVRTDKILRDNCSFEFSFSVSYIATSNLNGSFLYMCIVLLDIHIYILELTQHTITHNRLN